MTGPKLNEKSFVAGERSGTKATAKYVRSSASKARVVLDLIRGLDVQRADEVLQFTERGIAHDIRKVLASAVANASPQRRHQDADELFVLACFADEGPTLRRFRPRARGRATRIRKRTCHITIVVARMSDDRLEIMQGRQERAGGSGRPPAARRAQRQPPPRRAERSRQQAEPTRRPTRSPTTRPTTRPSRSDAAEEPRSTPSITDEPAAADDEPTPTSDSDAEAGFAEARFEGADAADEDGSARRATRSRATATRCCTTPGRYYEHQRRGVLRHAESAEAAGYAKPGVVRRRGTSDGSEDQPVRLPPRRDHRLEEPLVLRA